MRQFVVILFVFTIISCEYFNVKKTSSDAILKEELQTFNWDDVDTYPTFTVCDSLTSKTDKKDCFQYTLTSNITAYLQKQMIVVTKDVNDTLVLKMTVTNTGKIKLLEAKMDALTQQEIPELEALLFKSLDTLPEIFPAIKRGQHVTSEFELPLIIKVN
ncbi:hypothetical protein [Jejuia pallidilutea]|uniref:Uncharacterized protein n=1 Tax=Jejuia pallidilutea TaxID=504487 RepID=A0A090WGW7_9FLAO|nr:hypothetical protein [Jejuia pallidilutea]GAL66757.1 hypothetical protein JCM19301_1301 [Jejuia pallidilutea]GAL70457.1 hypothetical protein JCM19302_3579 [Jejuia pallidilutea]GAL90523.1 hypothetical protein JCM19538_288 [Jejuia pallidilutea]